MPTDDSALRLRHRQVLRYALGATISVAIAFGVGWPLAYVTPVLTVSFLGLPGKALGVGTGFQILLSMAGACILGLVLSITVLKYSLVFIPLIGLLLLRIFYAKAGGASPLLITWLLIAFTLMPVLGMESQVLIIVVLKSLVLAGLISIALTWIMHGLLPDPPVTDTGAAAPATADSLGEAERFAAARRSTLVVFPVMLAFLYFDWSSSVLALIFITLLSMQPDASKGFKGGMALITGNAMGGLAAIITYNLLVIVPVYGFMVLLVFLQGLWFGDRLFSGTKKAPLYGMAYSTMLLLIGSVTLSTGDAAGNKFYIRILQIMAAVLYVVVAFGMLERRDRQQGKGGQQQDQSQDSLAGSEANL